MFVFGGRHVNFDQRVSAQPVRISDKATCQGWNLPASGNLRRFYQTQHKMLMGHYINTWAWGFANQGGELALNSYDRSVLYILGIFIFLPGAHT